MAIKFNQKFKIIEEGDMSPLDDVLDKMESKIKEGVDYTLYLMDKKIARTLSANRYYFGVVLKTIAEHMGEKNLEITIADLHEVLKSKFNGKVVLIDGDAYEIGETTKIMSQDRFVEYIEEIRIWALDELECWIPLPTQVLEEEFVDLYLTAYHENTSK